MFYQGIQLAHTFCCGFGSVAMVADNQVEIMLHLLAEMQRFCAFAHVLNAYYGMIGHMAQVVCSNEERIGLACIVKQRRPTHQGVGGGVFDYRSGMFPYIVDVPRVVLVEAVHGFNAGNNIGKFAGEPKQGLAHMVSAEELFELLL